MAFNLASSQGTLNGTTSVTIVPSPVNGVTRTVRLINIYNADTAAVTVLLICKVGSSEYVLSKATLSPGQSLLYDDPIVLDSTIKSVVARLESAPSANQPHYLTSYGDSALEEIAEVPPGGDADTVDGFHASATPTANHLLALDINAKLPTDITGDADTLDGYHAEDILEASGGDADTVDGYHASATAQANTLLALNSSAKLPASITGDADTVDGYHAEDFEMSVAPDKMVAGYTSDMTDTSDTTVISAPGSGYRLYITQLTVINSHASTGTWVNIKSGSTTVYTVYAAPGGGGVSITFRTPLRLGSNEALVAACATSGANVRVSACGYKDTV